MGSVLFFTLRLDLAELSSYKRRCGMKIGELAKLTGVSKDSIRFYVENGLLFPDRQGPQMDFSDREQEDLFYIKRLRKHRCTRGTNKIK